MVEFSTPIEMFIYILDLFGTMAFAVTGAFKAIEHKADIVGIIILATITGVAGGTIRDVILGKSLPNSLIDPSYVVITVIITYDGSINEFGSDFPNTTSRIVPPATPVIVAKMIIPTMSALCSIALNAPVTANAIVPKRSKI